MVSTFRGLTLTYDSLFQGFAAAGLLGSLAWILWWKLTCWIDLLDPDLKYDV